MHDSSLDEICRSRPASLAEIRGISGFGEKKTERYGQQILQMRWSDFIEGRERAALPEK